MTRKLTLLSATIAAIALTAAAQAAEPGVTATEVKLGGSTALTGPGALVGIAHDLGEKVAAAEINDAGGINGRKLVRYFEDDGYVPSRTVQAMRKLVEIDEVLGVTASSGTASTIAALPLAEEKGVPMLQTAAQNTVMFNPPHKNLFGVGRSYGPGTTEFVKFLAGRTDKSAKWIAVVQDDDYGDDVQSGYEKAVKELGLTSVGVLRYKRGQKEFSAEIVKAKQLGAKMIVSGAIIGENVAMAKEMKRIGLDAQLAILWSGRIPQLIDLMGEAGNGVIAADYVGEFSDPAGQAFMAKAKKYLTADELTKLNRYSLTGYVGIMLMADAIKRCGQEVSRACVIAKLETTKDVQTNGLTSPINLSADNHVAELKLSYTIADFAKKEWVPLAK
ncbi:MAG: ABC transporter substrate-binding protein [Ferrovibrionaceae bacterium]